MPERQEEDTEKLAGKRIMSFSFKMKSNNTKQTTTWAGKENMPNVWQPPREYYGDFKIPNWIPGPPQLQSVNMASGMYLF